MPCFQLQEQLFVGIAGYNMCESARQVVPRTELVMHSMPDLLYLPRQIVATAGVLCSMGKTPTPDGMALLVNCSGVTLWGCADLLQRAFWHGGSRGLL